MVLSLYEIAHWNAKIEYGETPSEVALKGVITDLTAPTLEREFDTAKRAGELGVVPRPKFFNEVEISFTVRNIFEELITGLVTGTSRSITLTATACIEADDNSVEAYQIVAKGFISSLPLGELSEDGFESEVTMMCYEFSAELGDFEMVYDPRNYVLSIGVTNLFEGIKDIIDPEPPTP